MAKKTVGRPPKYKSKEQIESLIEQTGIVKLPRQKRI